MNKDREKELFNKHPRILRDMYGDRHRTCMHWGLEVGDGWYDLIDVLCASIQAHVDSKVEALRRDPRPDVDHDSQQVVAVQVKEKFGGLRFYVSNSDDVVDGMIRLAESLSRRLCEDCGHPGRARSGGWIRVQCDQCHQKRQGPAPDGG